LKKSLKLQLIPFLPVTVVDSRTLTIRIDESVSFVNARSLEEHIYDKATNQPRLQNVILMCSSVNAMDMSAFKSLEVINEQLKLSGVKFHLSGVKNTVMNRSKKTSLLMDLNGCIFFSQHQENSFINSNIN
tara:strand:- start:6089 stop:6481 length:393 start_codon:yes stop_codon:yes gene_type:complete